MGWGSWQHQYLSRVALRAVKKLVILIESVKAEMDRAADANDSLWTAGLRLGLDLREPIFEVNVVLIGIGEHGSVKWRLLYATWCRCTGVTSWSSCSSGRV